MSTIYYGGYILTMEQEPFAEAVMIMDGYIKWVGSEEYVFSKADKNTQFVNLNGKTLIPAFIDTHSHITAYAETFGMVDLNGATSFNDIGERIEKFRDENNIQPGEWIRGFGYDHNRLLEKKHPDKTVLDEYAKENPVVISHSSGHMGVLNSLALQEGGITPIVPNPKGGKIGRTEDGTDVTGYLEETAFTLLDLNIPSAPLEHQLLLLEKAQDQYLKYGITTTQDGFTKEKELQLLVSASLLKKLKIDVICFIEQSLNEKLLWQNPLWVKQYFNNLKIGGYKIFLDGSPQGRTAWMSEPYENAEDNYSGYPIYTDEQVKQFFRTVIKDYMQVLVHCNGDAAAEQMISIWDEMVNGYNIGLRPVMIHSQFVRKDQLQRMQRLGMIVSFFIAHIYYWSDIYMENLGEKRTLGMSPVNSAIKAGTVYTFHQDTPVLPPDMLLTVDIAVNRINKDGLKIGTNERISVLDALKGVTINAAYQNFENNNKGSIREGKVADLLILDKNPLIIESTKIKDIQILQTIKSGEVLYQKQ